MQFRARRNVSSLIPWWLMWRQADAGRIQLTLRLDMSSRYKPEPISHQIQFVEA